MSQGYGFAQFAAIVILTIKFGVKFAGTNMIRKTKNGITWLEFKLLQDYPLVHGVVLRAGGVSPPPYDSLNLGFSTKDDPKNVEKNLDLLRSTFSLSHIVSGFQVHKDQIAHINENSPPVMEGYDGFITSTKNTTLLIKHADCQAAIFYDPKKNIIAASHSGWRGSVLNIYGKTVKKLQELGSTPKNILVCISPSLGPENAQFINYEKELPKDFHLYQIKPYYFDFWAISAKQLEDAGILPENIEIAGKCTYEDQKDFFSYRREKDSGRNGTFIMLS